MQHFVSFILSISEPVESIGCAGLIAYTLLLIYKSEALCNSTSACVGIAACCFPRFSETGCIVALPQSWEAFSWEFILMAVASKVGGLGLG